MVRAMSLMASACQHPGCPYLTFLSFPLLSLPPLLAVPWPSPTSKCTPRALVCPSFSLPCLCQPSSVLKSSPLLPLPSHHTPGFLDTPLPLVHACRPPSLASGELGTSHVCTCFVLFLFLSSFFTFFHFLASYCVFFCVSCFWCCLAVWAMLHPAKPFPVN